MNGLFVAGMIFQSSMMGRHFIGDKWAFCFPLVLFFNPIFLGHSMLVSPDNLLVFLLLVAINGIIKRKSWLLVLGTVLLVAVSMRGMMVVLSLSIAILLWKKLDGKKGAIEDFLLFVPAGICALSFLSAHYIHNSWIGFHGDSPWRESFNIISLSAYFKNLLIIIWRLVDFGNVFIVSSLGFILYKSKGQVKNISFFTAFLLAFALVFVLPLASFKYLTAHRYFMPIYLITSLAFVSWMVEKKFWRLGGFILLLLFSGNWWIYPRNFSQGWDVSLAHQPFYGLVEEMNSYISEQGIDVDEVGTEFPLKSASKYLYLDEDYPEYGESRVGEKRYILYSKVINDYKLEDFQRLEKEYILTKDFNHFFIDLKLYEKGRKVETGGTQ